MKYTPSKYNHFFTFEEKNYVYNILSTSIVELEDSIIEALKNANIDALDKEVFDGLFEEGMLVESGTNESQKYSYYYDSIRYGDSASLLKLTILPTYGCNLACPYCFEGKNKNPKAMSQKELDAIINFISKQIDTNRDISPINRLHISFFGGEPLLCKDSIEYICSKAAEIANEENLYCAYDITTNLTLLNDDFIKTIKKHRIELQVTFDGGRSEHNQRRIDKHGNGTFDTIFEHLEKLVSAGLKDLITIRINIDDSNIASASKLFSEVSQMAGNVYFGYLKDYKSYNDDFTGVCIDKRCFSKTSVEKLYDVFEQNGLDVPIEFGKRSPCVLNQQNCYVIDPLLDVYKCELLQNHKECKVGVLTYDGDFIPNKSFYNQMAFVPWRFEKCRECKLMPLCGAGCPSERYIQSGQKDGDILFPNCISTEESLTEYLCDYIKRHR